MGRRRLYDGLWRGGEKQVSDMIVESLLVAGFVDEFS